MPTLKNNDMDENLTHYHNETTLEISPLPYENVQTVNDYFIEGSWSLAFVYLGIALLVCGMCSTLFWLLATS